MQGYGVAGNFSLMGVVNKWNSLPPEVVNCNTIDTFKKKYDKHVGVNREAIHS